MTTREAVRIAHGWMVAENGYSVEATDAGLDRGVMRVTLSIRQGEMLHSKDRASLTSEIGRRGVLKKLAARGVEISEATLLTLDEACRQPPPTPPPTPEPALPDTARTTGPYVARNNRLYFIKRVGQDGEEHLPLTNFVATIAEEVITDDGATERGELIIDGVHASGRPLAPIRVPLTQFAAMNWPMTQWGSHVIVSAGMGAKDRAREAIQILSPDVPRRIEYGHCGWRWIDGRWVYLHAGGGIGADGVVGEIEVRLSGDLDCLVLPVPPEGADLHAACRASVSVVDLAPARITGPLLAAAYRAPTNELSPADLSVFLSGFTGRFKTELAALAQQHFGAGWSRTKLPASWEATANALERIAFEAKDVAIVYDDFVPGSSQQRISEMNAKADRVLRGAGNRSARARMSADGRLRPDYPPRGTIIATGEEIPRGQSLRARLAVAEIAAGDVNLDRLTTAQADGAAGMFAAATAGYVRWLAPRMDALRASIGADLSALRTAALASGTAHSRTPDVTANLGYGWKQFLAFCLDVGAIDLAEHDRLWQRVWTALCTLAQEQAGIQKTEDQTYRYLDLMLTAVASQQAHVANMDGHAPTKPQVWGWEAVPTYPTSDDGRTYTEYEYRPKGPRIGWLDAETLYLLPAASLSAVQKIAATNGAAIGLSERTLGARLHERGALVAGGNGGYTVPRTVEGGKQRVFAISLPYLSAQLSDTSDTEGTIPHGDAENPYRIGAETSDTGATTSDTESDADPIPGQHPIRTEPVVARGNAAVSDVSDNPDTMAPPEQNCACALSPTFAEDCERLRLFAEMTATGDRGDGPVTQDISACAERLGITIDPASDRRSADAILAWLAARRKERA